MSNRHLVVCAGIAIALFLSGCQKDNSLDNGSSSVVGAIEGANRESSKQMPSVQKSASDVGSIPTYDSVTELESTIEGRLSIIDGCVYLLGPDNNRTIIVFPKGSAFSKNGKAIVSLNKTVNDGEQVSFSGTTTTRTFWKSFASGIDYQPISESCKGDAVWLAGQMTKL